MSGPAPAPARRIVHAEPLVAAAFRAFGEVIDRRSTQPAYAINGGTAQRVHDLARIDVSTRGGHAAISVVHASPRPLPVQLEGLERHSRGSQAFVPIAASRWVVIVAPGGRTPDLDKLRAFVASGVQGVNYARGTWHHPLIVLDHDAEFLVVDRAADDGLEDCDVSDRPGLEGWLHAGSEGGFEIRTTL
ncbi:MAG: ureidoglycolate lyase [Pseudomonadota bacterium]|nr:ureidoglycolate lyase [Pseudomonadota bacterium]